MIDLFNLDDTETILPFDGTAILYENWLKTNEADYYFKSLLGSIDWHHDEIVMFGKKIVTSRKVGWYGDRPFRYIYSKTEKVALPWNSFLVELKQKVEEVSEVQFNSCLLNLYHNGSEGMGWHSDDEKSLDPNAPIASVSLGARRTFRFKHKTKDFKTSIELTNGSLLLMNPPTQEFWLHTLTKTNRVNTPRINLTFRSMLPQ